MTFEDWKKEALPNGSVVTALFGTGVNIEQPFKSAYDTGYDTGYAEGYETSNLKKDIIIDFLKKELIHKTCYRQVMKRQFNELKRKYEAIKPKERIMGPTNIVVAEFSVQGWTKEEKQELFKKWKEINKRRNVC